MNIVCGALSNVPGAQKISLNTVTTARGNLH